MRNKAEAVVVHSSTSPFDGTHVGVLVSGRVEPALRFYLSRVGEIGGAMTAES